MKYYATDEQRHKDKSELMLDILAQQSLRQLPEQKNNLYKCENHYLVFLVHAEKIFRKSRKEAPHRSEGGYKTQQFETLSILEQGIRCAAKNLLQLTVFAAASVVQGYRLLTFFQFRLALNAIADSGHRLPARFRDGGLAFLTMSQAFAVRHPASG